MTRGRSCGIDWGALFSPNVYIPPRPLIRQLHIHLAVQYQLDINLTIQHLLPSQIGCQRQQRTTMGSFNSAGGVSVFELLIYFPALIVAAIVCSRHGFGRASGWVFTLILCLVRIIGACCQLATYSGESTGLIEAIIILESVGISPLLLATLGLLSRAVDSAGPNSGHFKAIHFRLLQLLITIGLILAIVGGTNSTSSTGVYTPQPTRMAGDGLYLVAFGARSFVGLVTLSSLSNAPAEDRRLVWAVLAALPFIIVRIIYSLITVFTSNSQFSLLTGSVIIHVFMAILEEMAVVVIYLAVGWLTPALPASAKGPVASRAWKMPLNGAGNASQGRGQGHRSGRRQGPIHALVGAGIAAAQQKPGEV